MCCGPAAPCTSSSTVARPTPRSPGPKTAVTPINRRLGGGCHLNRPIRDLLDRSGLEVTSDRHLLHAGRQGGRLHVRGNGREAMILPTDDPLALKSPAARRGDVECSPRFSATTPGWQPRGSAPTSARARCSTCSPTGRGIVANGAATVALLVDAGCRRERAIRRSPHRDARCTGRRAATTSTCSTRCSTWEPTSRPTERGDRRRHATARCDRVRAMECARRLVERGAGDEVLAGGDARLPRPRRGSGSSLRPPTHEEVTEAFWGACHGGQRVTAERLLAEEPTSTGSVGTTSPRSTRRCGAGRRRRRVASFASSACAECDRLDGRRGQDRFGAWPPQRSRCSSVRRPRAKAPTRCSPTARRRRLCRELHEGVGMAS